MIFHLILNTSSILPRCYEKLKCTKLKVVSKAICDVSTWLGSGIYLVVWSNSLDVAMKTAFDVINIYKDVEYSRLLFIVWVV